MHKFLKAIGFSDITKKQLDDVIKNIIDKPEKLKVTKDSEGNEFAELSCDVAPNMGITVRGIYNDDDGEFSIIVEKDVIEMYIDSYKNQTTWVKCKDNGDIEKVYIVGSIDYIWDENDSKFIEPESLYEVTFVRIKLPINLKNIFVVNAWEDKWLPYSYIVEKYKKDENH